MGTDCPVETDGTNRYMYGTNIRSTSATMHDMNLYTVWFHLMISLNDYDFNFKIILKICQLTLKVKIILANI